MSIAFDPETSSASVGASELGHRPLTGLDHAGGEAWRSADWDPQFLLTPPASLRAGLHRLTVELEGGDIEAPCVYFDFGQGWSEATRREFEPATDESKWVLYVWLPAATGLIRFDPTNQPGKFRFGGASLERLDDAEAMLVLLRKRMARAPSNVAAEIVHEAHRRAAADGVEACCNWLLSSGSGSDPMPGISSYGSWVHRYDTLSAADAEKIHALLDRLPSRPLISVVLTAQDVSEDKLRHWLETFTRQLYPDWELHVVGAAPNRALDACIAKDSRIAKADADSGTVATIEQVLTAARGQYVVFLDADCLLPAHALFATADAIARNPGAQVIYSDSDRLEAGVRSAPYFKPRWNPELLLGQNYLAPFVAYDLRLVREAGRPRADFDGAAAYDLALRCTSRATPEKIVHIPLVLCHSSQKDTNANVPGGEAGLRVLSEHLQDAGADAQACEGGYRVRHRLPDPAPKVSVIIPTRDKLDLLRRCIESILSRTTYPNFEVVIVDNQSELQETRDFFASLSDEPRVRVLPFDAPFNYSAINNHAVQNVGGDIIALVNNDVEVISPDWLEEMVQYAIRPDVGGVGAMLYYPDDTIQHAGVVLGLGGVAGHIYSKAPRGTSGQMGRAHLVQSLSAVTAACLLVRRSVFLEIGGLDEKLRVAFNDVDFCLRLLEHGYRNIWTPFAELYHHESASRGYEDTPEKMERFHSEVHFMIERWSAWLGDDAAYNPNLSLLHGDSFALADPPRSSIAGWIRQSFG